MDKRPVDKDKTGDALRAMAKRAAEEGNRFLLRDCAGVASQIAGLDERRFEAR